MTKPHDTLTHLTLTTGHRRDSPRHEVGEAALAAVRPLLRHGGGPIPGCPGYRVVLTREGLDAVFTVYNGRGHPLVTCGLARERPQDVWDALVQIMDPAWSRGPRAPRPEGTPWLGVVLLPTGLTTARAALSWMADFERVLAWALIEDDATTAELR
jgi:hypothetical protein